MMLLTAHRLVPRWHMRARMRMGDGEFLLGVFFFLTWPSSGLRHRTVAVLHLSSAQQC